MADITITAGNVLPGAGASISDGVAGVAVTAGQLVYYDRSTASYKLADADSATAAVRSPAGITLNSAGAGQPIEVLHDGLITIGGTVTAGVPYFASKNAGGICPYADIASGGYATFVGIATSASVLKVEIVESGVAV